NDDVPRKGILLKHEVERRVDFFRWKLPGHQRAFSEVRGHERLPNATDRARAEHRPDALHDCFRIDAGPSSDLADRIAHKALNSILGDRQNPGIGGVGMRDRGFGESGHTVSKIACWVWHGS